MPRAPRRFSRGTAFVGLATACLLAAGGYVTWAATRDATGAAVDPIAAAKALQGAARGTNPAVMFQYVARDASAGVLTDEKYAHIGLTPLANPGGRVYSGLVCERVYFAGQRGLCLALEQDPLRSKYVAKIFGPDFKVRHEVPLTGPPSRARVSPDGRYGATTVFVFGHSYRDSAFSTQTELIDMASGKPVIENLEEFAVFRDGARIKARDFNFWGVTFARDSNRFYATLMTRGKTYLVRGNVNGRRMHVLRENVECPSLSPDNTRLAFKKRIGGVWRLTVLNLATMVETPLAERRSIDDQVEWLDNKHVLYGFYGVWKVRADGTGKPQTFLPDGRSPAVIRQSSPTGA
jgi:hypothetical protein